MHALRLTPCASGLNPLVHPFLHLRLEDSTEGVDMLEPMRGCEQAVEYNVGPYVVLRSAVWVMGV